MKLKRPPTAVRRTSAAADEWERSWQEHWSKVGLPGYELPVGGVGGDDREFLGHARTPAREKQRLKRINDEFTRAFGLLAPVGPAVTVFGSARFQPDHRYYELGRAVGVEVARAGFATLTGGGPGIMEAANRGAHEAGGARFWDGMRKWGRFMMRQGVFGQEEIGFGRITDPPAEAVDLVVRSLPRSVKARLRPVPKRR